MNSDDFQTKMNEYEQEYFTRCMTEGLATLAQSELADDSRSQEEMEMRVAACAGAVARHAAILWASLMTNQPESIDASPNTFMQLVEKQLVGVLVQAAQMPGTGVEVFVVKEPPAPEDHDTAEAKTKLN